MKFSNYLGGLVADHASNRAVPNKIARVYDDETGERVKVYMEGQERTLASGAHGLLPPFQTEATTRRVRIEIGPPPYLRQWSVEMVDAGGAAVAELERLTVSHIALDTDGTPYFSPGSATVQVGQDTDGTPYIRL